MGVNTLYFGNNLDVLRREIPDQSADLVYLDPPFNSKAQYNILYRTPENARETAQRMVFRDSWHWEEEAAACFAAVLAGGGPAASILAALKSALGHSDTMAYLAMMAARLVEIRRVMKPSASLYLHCDPTASHYLKIVLDGILGPRSFKSEVVWKRTASHGGSKRWGPIHDTILFYAASERHTWNRVMQAQDAAYVENKYRFQDERGRYRLVVLTGPGTTKGASGQAWRGYDPTRAGRHWAVPRAALRALEAEGKTIPDQLPEQLELLYQEGFIRFPRKPDGSDGVPEFKLHLPAGKPIQDIVTDIAPINSQAREKLGYPTQKPVALLRRIIEASSNPGDVVLDPFCGCGTTVQAAAELDRRWIGIDVSYYGVRLIQRRVVANFGAGYPLEVKGIPADVVSGEALADENPYAFQQWAVDELGCQIWNGGKKGRDGGVDGEMWFFAGPGAPGRLLVQVKAGKKAGVGQVREFKSVMQTQGAHMGVFFSRAGTTPDMRAEASDMGNFRIGSTVYPRLQLVTLADWFDGRRPVLPMAIPLQRSQERAGRRKAKRPDPAQREMPFVFTGMDAQPGEGQVYSPTALPPEALRSDVA